MTTRTMKIQMTPKKIEQLKHCQRIIDAILLNDSPAAVPAAVANELCKVADLLGAVTENKGFNIEADKSE
jgi:hypothetical protein